MKQLSERMDAVDKAMKLVHTLFVDVTNNERDTLKYEEWTKQLKASTQSYAKTVAYLEEYCGKQTSLKRLLVHPFRRGVIDEKLRDIKWYHDILQSFVQVLQVKETNRVQNSVRSLQAIHQREQNDAWLESALKILYPDLEEVEKKLYEEVEKCRSSEPSWILKRSQYLEWLDGSNDKHKYLWAMGRPGAGKTCAASFVAYTLLGLNDQQGLDYENQNQTDSQNHGVREGSSSTEKTISSNGKTPLSRTKTSQCPCGIALFYCNFQHSTEQDVLSIFRCLSRQLLDQLWNFNPDAAHERMRLYETTQSSKISPKAVIKSLFAEVLQDFQNSFVIIDALDENSEHFEELYPMLQDLVLLPGVRILVTSRDGEDGHLYQAALDAKAVLMRIRPEDKQIRTYVDSRLNRIANGQEYGVTSGLVDAIRQVEERDDISYKITSAADGNYLCAELQITMLRKMTKETLRKRLASLPSTLKDLFRDTMKRIEMQDDRNGWKRGQRALLWTLYSLRPLSVAELSHALAIYSMREGDQGAMTDQPSAQEIVESTCFFLSIDKDTSRIEVHKAMKDYCDSSGGDVQERYFGNPHFELANICLRYLSSDAFPCGPAISAEQWQNRVKNNPLFLYAAQNWGSHIVKSSEETRFLGDNAQFNVIQLIEDNLMTNTIAQALQQPLLSVSTDYALEEQQWVQLNPGEDVLMPALHILIYFKLEKIMNRFVVQYPEEIARLSKSGFVPLWLACRLGYSNVVRSLLRKGADPKMESSGANFCLAAATNHGHLDVVKLLLSHGRQEKVGEELLRQKNRNGRLPVADVASTGRPDIFQLVLDHLARMQDGNELLCNQDDSGEGILHIAVDNVDIIIMLLERPEYQNAVHALLRLTENDWGDYPIHSCVTSGHLGSLEALLKVECTAQLGFRQKQGREPLSLAIERPFNTHGKVAQLLLRLGADPTARDVWMGMTALHAAAFWGRPLQLKQLLKDERCSQLLEIKDGRGLTPLQVAWKDQRNDWKGVVALLLLAGSREPEIQTVVCNDRIIYVKNMESPYLVTSEIPASARLPVQRMFFKTISHDQGWADDFPWDHGGYHNSATRFDIARWKHGKAFQRLKLTHNLRAHKEKKFHDITWDTDRGDLGGGSRGDSPQEQEEVTNFLRSLNHGDRIALIPVALYPGWKNYVYKAEISITYIIEAEKP